MSCNRPPPCLQIVAGCPTALLFTATDEGGLPFSLTGSRVRFAVRRNFKDTFVDMVVVKDSNNGPTEIEILPDPDSDKARIYLEGTDTENLEEGLFNVSVHVSVGDNCYRAFFNFLSVVKNMFTP